MIEKHRAVIEAAKANDLAELKKLIEADGSLATSRLENGESAILAAQYRGHKGVVEYLIGAGAGLNLFEACAAGVLHRVEAQVTRETVDAFAPDGFTPLGLAAFFGHQAVVELLLRRGADPNIGSNNVFSVKPLHSAAAGRHTAIARLLIERGADVNARQQSGFTPLHSAAGNGQRDMVELLLARGADPQARSDEGLTPAAIAKERGHRDVAELLRGPGSSPL